jgi:DNA repair exonuclease SbcCD nuclease subunit
MQENFLQRLNQYYSDTGTRTIILAGNHDTFYKDTNRINALYELVKHDCFDVHIEPFSVRNMAFFPWICAENQERSMELLRLTDAEYVFGHFEINGAEMQKGYFCDHGLDRDVFKRFKRVFSGHFHHKTTAGNIEYLGAPYEMTWSDAGFPRGFHYFDTDTNDLQFVHNPHTLFNRIEYNDVGKTLPQLMEMDFSKFSETFVKVVVNTKSNPYWFDLFLEKIESAGPIDVKVIEESFQIEYSDEEIGQSVDDPLTILKNHCKSEKHSELVEKKLTQLYNQATMMVI